MCMKVSENWELTRIFQVRVQSEREGSLKIRVCPHFSR